MASIYSETSASSVTAWSDIRPSSTVTSSATSTLSFDLEKFRYEPMNSRTLYQINDNINRHVTAGAASGILTLNNSFTIDSGTATSGDVISNNNRWIDNFEPYNNAAEMSQEEIKKQEKAYQRDFKLRKIKSNLLIKIKPRGTAHKYIPENEQLAVDTLREYITEAEFRKYLRFGFVCVEGLTGKTYQIFRNGSHTKVWKNGNVIDEICVHIKDSKVPPTDSVIAFRTMIKTSEENFYKLGNVYKMRRP